VGTVDYEQIRHQLAEAGLRDCGGRHDESAFGSWLIIVEHEPLLRVVWDGKEGHLTVQRQTDSGWLDAWFARTETDQTADAIIEAIASV
jgi:hypothetical protein